MTIHSLVKAGFLDEIDNANTNPPFGLAFAIDARYVDLLKVMLYSMALARTCIHSPITIYSDDETVFDDPVIKICADRKVLLAGEKRDLLYTLAKENVRQRDRETWNKGTFLKWMVFEEQLTESVLFLDVDMICLRNIEFIGKLSPGRSFLCCPQFQSSLQKNPDRSFKRSQEIYDGLNDLIIGAPLTLAQRRVNSGVMLIRKELLCDNFFDEITQFARTSVATNEQGHFTRYFGRHKSQIRFMTADMNFQEVYMFGLPWAMHEKIIPEIKIMHYAGANKPWQREPRDRFRPTSALWHAYRTGADNLIHNRPK